MTTDDEVKTSFEGKDKCDDLPKSRLFPSARMTVAIMMFLACVLAYILRLNMGFAMVCMTKSSPDTQNGSLPVQNEEGELVWEKSLQGAILAAFFYGYIITQLPSGWLADRFGGKIVLTVGLGVFSVLALLLPEAGRLDPYALLAVRVLQGMFSAVTFPAIHSVFGNWAPPSEIGVLMGIAYSGMYAGTLLTFPICGLLCEYGFAGGWPSVFYVTGLMGVAYVIAMWFIVHDKFEKHPRISQKERRYLEKTVIGHHKAAKSKLVTIPWKDIVKSAPVWAICVAHFTSNYGFYFLVINLPLFMDEVLNFNITENGFLSSLPYIASFCMTLISGKLSDFLRRKAWFSFSTQRKLFNSAGMIVPAIGMLSLTFMRDPYQTVAVITIVQGFSGFAYSGGFFYNHVDLSPKHAGILMGFTNTFGTVPGIVAPLLVGLLTPNETQEEWNILFYIGAALYLVGAIAYIIFASGERQEWSYTTEELKEQVELKAVFLEQNSGSQEKEPDQLKASV